MNIFVLDLDPQKAAEYHVDRHVVKMVLESTQILSTVMNINGLKGPYKSTHINHPCVKWVQESHYNFYWLKSLLNYLLAEYTIRYGKTHKCESLFHSLVCPDQLIKTLSMTPFVQCMPEQYKVKNDPVQAYRNYYIGEKKSFATWKNGNVPDWWK